MIREEKCIVVDIDGTLCPLKKPDECYADLVPYEAFLARLREYKARGFHIVLYTSRNMRSYQGNIGLIMARTAKEVLAWLDRHEVPYDEIHFGKPWPGRDGFYVDDRAIRPDEFLRLEFEEIQRLIGNGHE